MNIAMINPVIPDTFWSFSEAIQFISKKATQPPLGLLTIASFLPDDWNVKLIDLNVTHLSDQQILRADFVWLSGMNVQKKSFLEVLHRCKQLKIPVIAGGPMVTLQADEFEGIDIMVLGEAEEIMPELIRDLESGNWKPVYQAKTFPSLEATPVPRWELLDMNQYAAMNLQYSRGCPFHCEFCSITLLNGHVPRTKSVSQFIQEMESLYKAGWKGPVFIVDDNFIGNKRKVKSELLPAMTRWQRDHDYPFTFGVEASINIADDPELVKLMVEAGIDHVFVGIETVSQESLHECRKKNNAGRNMVKAVRLLHQHGMQVSAGFILGFDHDNPSIFDQLIQFIQQSHIVTAMVGLLNAPKGTPLFDRLQKEGRILNTEYGDNMDGRINFIPKMDYDCLIKGYKMVLNTIYAPENYYRRMVRFIREFQPIYRFVGSIGWREIKAFLKCIWYLGIIGKERKFFWKYLLTILFKQPDKLPTYITMAIYGYHFRKIAEKL